MGLPQAGQHEIEGLPMDVNRLVVDICQALDPVKRNRLRTLVQELTAKKAAREIPSVTKALVERAPAVVGPDLWRACCEKQHRDVPAPPDQPAASDAPWRCHWCKTSKSRRLSRKRAVGLFRVGT